MTNAKLIELKQKAARYDWLTSDSRGDYVWYHVLSEKHRDHSDNLEECIDIAIENDKISTS